MALYFVGGIHGAGKTSLCCELSRFLPLFHVAASALIFAQQGRLPNRRGKRVSNLLKNQAQLLDALRARSSEGSHILLDGHFCLMDAAGRVTRVPYEVFVRMDPAALIVVSATPDTIQERLLLRDKRTLPFELIKEFQALEVASAQEVSASLRRPLLQWSELDGFAKAIDFLAPLVSMRGRLE